MTLVESIAGELLPVCPDLFQNFFRMSILIPPLEKLHLQNIHLFDEFFAHSLTKLIALASGKTGKLATQKHDLLLIHRHTISFFEIFFHLRQVVIDRLTPMLACDKRRDIVHRTGTIESIHRYQVLESRGL